MAFCSFFFFNTLISFAVEFQANPYETQWETSRQFAIDVGKILFTLTQKLMKKGLFYLKKKCTHARTILAQNRICSMQTLMES